MLSNNKTLIRMIDYLIQGGSPSWKNLDEIDQELLVSEAMRGLGDDAYVCITESDEMSEILLELRRHLNTGNNMYDLAYVMTESVKKYFSPELEALFLERKSSLDSDFYYENGYLPSINQQTGETEWSRY